MTQSNTDTARTRSFAAQAARASWIAPLLAVALNMFAGRPSGDRAVGLTVGVIACMIILVGFILALWAIVCGATRGPHRLLVPGTIGLVLNGLLVLLIVHTFHGLGEPAQRQSKGTSASDSWIPDGDGWHVDKQRAFALRFPDDWEIRKDAYEGVAVIALSSEESTDDTFRENITVVAAPIRQRWDTKAFFDANVHDMRANAEGYQEHSTGTLNIGGLDCPWVSFSQKVQGVPTHVHSYCIASKGYGYAIMCAAAPDAMDRYEKQFESVVKTLKIPRE